jgi:ABC-type polysaccharide/polyol phosphate export permease
MKIISRKMHGGLDYASAILLIASPWLFNFEDVDSAKTVAIAAGILIIVMSLMTNYESGMVKVIPMNIHLYADILLGILLVASPWLFKFNDQTYLFHVIMGLFAILSGVMTNNESLQHNYNNNQHHSMAK